MNSLVPSTDPEFPEPPFPEPPFSGDLLAAYHAGALTPGLSRHIAARLDDDPRGRRILAALTATRDQLAGLSVEPADLPPAVDERLRNLVRNLGNTKP